MAKSKPIAILMFQPNPASMCSREIADITGKPHDEVLQDIRDTLEVPVEPEYHLEEKLALFLVTGEGYGSAYGRRGWAEIHARFLEIGAGSVKPLDAETFVRAATMARASAIPKIVEALNAAAEDDPFMSQVLREAAQELGWVDEDPIEP